jgi:hypothetical protein
MLNDKIKAFINQGYSNIKHFQDTKIKVFRCNKRKNKSEKKLNFLTWQIK